jgi:hypothetical protein
MGYSYLVMGYRYDGIAVCLRCLVAGVHVFYKLPIWESDMLC